MRLGTLWMWPGWHGSTAWKTGVKRDQSPENMEEQKELVYVCALLHDIGRASQYEEGIHHSKAGAAIGGTDPEGYFFPAGKKPHCAWDHFRTPYRKKSMRRRVRCFERIYLQGGS